MTSPTPSILPAPVDAGRSADSASFSRAPRQESTERSFEEFCSDANCAGPQKPAKEVRPDPEAQKPAAEDSASQEEKPAVAGETTPVDADVKQPSQEEKPPEASAVVVPTKADALPASPTVGQKTAVVGQPANNPGAIVPQTTGVSTNAPAVAANPEAKTATVVPEKPATVAADSKATETKPVVAASLPTVEEAPVDAEQAKRSTNGRFGGRHGNAALEGEEGKVFRANFAARHGISEEARDNKEPKDFLTVGKQVVAKLRSLGGTDTATPTDSMNLAPKFSAQTPGTRPTRAAEVADFSGGAGTQFSWKGWTNGGGEHVSAAARISHMAGAFPAVTTSGGVSEGTQSTGANATTSSAPVNNPWSSMDAKAALAPVGAAIERMMVRGQEQLSVTIRFEQGGSLSLKLGMANGEIAARIQTDVAGLDKALRSGWGEFAHDWNGRGIKLAAPVITSHTQSFAQHEHNSAGQREGNPRGHEFAEPRDERGSFERGFRSRRPSRGSGVDAGQQGERVSSNNRPMDRIRSGLKTWA